MNAGKSRKLFPGVRLTVSKRGASFSAWPKGAKVIVNARGCGSLGFLGLFWRHHL